MDWKAKNGFVRPICSYIVEPKTTKANEFQHTNFAERSAKFALSPKKQSFFESSIF